MIFIHRKVSSAINNEQLIINNYPFLKRIGLSQRKIFDFSPIQGEASRRELLNE